MPTTRARRALVTGASSGIGEATARLLAARGYRLALLARRAARLTALADELGPTALPLPCDVTDEQALGAAAERVEQEFGGLDLLACVAGGGYRARVDEIDPNVARRVFDVNVLGVLLTCRAFHPLLVKGERSVCVLVSSVVARRGIPGQAVYSASKAAVTSIGEALRLEWKADGIAVATLSPGLTSTGFFEAQPNPAGLADPDLSRADPAERVAEELVALDQRPRPERWLRNKWRALSVLGLLAPRLADRLLARRIGLQEISSAARSSRPERSRSG